MNVDIRAAVCMFQAGVGEIVSFRCVGVRQVCMRRFHLDVWVLGRCGRDGFIQVCGC